MQKIPWSRKEIRRSIATSNITTIADITNTFISILVKEKDKEKRKLNLIVHKALEFTIYIVVMLTILTKSILSCKGILA